MGIPGGASQRVSVLWGYSKGKWKGEFLLNNNVEFPSDPTKMVNDHE